MRSLAVAAALATLACSGPKVDPVDASAAPPRLEGQIRIADVWNKIAPPVMHDARMDLATRCLLMRDDAKAKGQDVPVCYDTSNKAARAITAITVERDKSMAVAMQRLTAGGEGAHFVVDHGGAIFQVLDLAYAPRRAGAYQAGEIRVIACDEAGMNALLDALALLYPTATVSITDHQPDKGSEP